MPIFEVDFRSILIACRSQRIDEDEMLRTQPVFAAKPHAPQYRNMPDSAPDLGASHKLVESSPPEMLLLADCYAQLKRKSATCLN
jgi:hypothetical protein